MILDSSAIVTILLRQPGTERLLKAIADAPLVAVGAPTLVESAIVIVARLGEHARSLPLEFAREGGVEVLPFDDAHISAAIDAFLRYGKGRHPAALNLGDCMAYATAYVARQPLLYVGRDFAKTDIESALA